LTAKVAKRSVLKVLNVIIEDRVGGPQLQILQVAKKLKNKDIETIVVIPDNNGGFQDLLKQQGIKFYEIPYFRRPRFTLNPIEHLKYVLSLIPSILALRRIIKEEQIDIVHQNDIMQIQGPIAAKLSNTKVLWHLQGMSYPLISKLFIPFPYFLADRVICAARAIGEGYFKSGRMLFRKTFGVLYAPVDTDRFNGQNSIDDIKEEYGIDDSYTIIGMVGNLNPIKGHRYFIEAACLTKEKWKQTKFLIIGKKLENRNSYIRQLERLVAESGLEDSIIFTGDRSDMPEVFSSLDIFVLPSLSEACPMVLLEAMASEIPCVASRVGGVPEIINSRDLGVLVPPKDPKAIAQGIVDILAASNKGKRMGKNGRERIISKFSLDICAESHYELYRSLVEATT